MPGFFEAISRQQVVKAERLERPCRMLLLPLVSVAILVVSSPRVSMAQQSMRGSERLVVSDVELGPQGQWAGEIVNAQGIGLSGAAGRLSNGRGPIADIIADSNGRFAVANMIPGVHLLNCGGRSHFYRFWKYGTAPPKAVRHSLIVAQGSVTRGVQGSQIYDWLAEHPGLTYTGIAAAIVVPVVVVGATTNPEPASP